MANVPGRAITNGKYTEKGIGFLFTRVDLRFVTPEGEDVAMFNFHLFIRHVSYVVVCSANWSSKLDSGH